MTRTARWRVAGLAVAILVSLVTCAGAQASSIRLGLFDFRQLTGSDAARWLPQAQKVGTQIVRVSTAWSTISPSSRGAGFVASDPTSAGYRWSGLDAQVKTLTNAGLDVLLTVQHAPTWAEGANRPSTTTAPSGSWRPDPSDLSDFMTALATRYSGSFPDPSGTGTLPQISTWQIWNEPNLWKYLSPQWTKTGGEYRLAAPSLYRSLLNAGYAAIKKVQPDATVLAAGTAPFGDLNPGENRIGPVLFWRDFLCLEGTQLKKAQCPNPARFDAWDHHPYGVRAPTSHALNANDAVVPDIFKLNRLMRRAQAFHTVLPRGSKPLWITELSYDSNPPDPHGVSLNTQAKWLEQSFYLLWEQGVRIMFWFSITDFPAIPTYNDTYQSGLYLADGTAKPAATAYTFPFVRDRTRIWGRAPLDGELVIEQKSGSTWKPLRTMMVKRHDVFDITVKVKSSAVLRARQGTQTSLTWPVA